MEAAAVPILLTVVISPHGVEWSRGRAHPWMEMVTERLLYG